MTSKCIEYAQYSSKTLPSASVLKLNQRAWLEVYWKKLGDERGKELSDADKAWNIPQKSDPLDWSENAWETWID